MERCFIDTIIVVVVTMTLGLECRSHDDVRVGGAWDHVTLKTHLSKTLIYSRFVVSRVFYGESPLYRMREIRLRITIPKKIRNWLNYYIYNLIDFSFELVAQDSQKMIWLRSPRYGGFNSELFTQGKVKIWLGYDLIDSVLNLSRNIKSDSWVNLKIYFYIYS